MSMVTIFTTVIVARLTPGRVFPIVGGMVAFNVALNLVLIPRYEETGAAMAMLVSEVVLLSILGVIGGRAVGRIHWRATLTAPLAAGAALALVLVLVPVAAGWALAIGAAVYAGAFVLVERLVSPDDLAFVTAIVWRRLPIRRPR